jgi:peptidoglycan-N-acetylglucosamine deacetylase
VHRILLTFDDGPHAESTAVILDELARRGNSAVFFVLGEELEKPGAHALLQRAVSEGHYVGNHGYSHRRLTLLTDEEIRSDFRRTEALIGSLDRGVKLWRPPFGEHGTRVDSLLALLGYTRMLWNVGSRDWEFPPADDCVDDWVEWTLGGVRSRIGRGFQNTVCLFHDSLATTALHLPRLLDELSRIPGARVARYNPCDPEGISIEPEANVERTGALHCTDAVSFAFEELRVLVRPRHSTLYILNQSAGFLWDTLASGSSESEAARELADCYGIAEDLAVSDVRTALEDWRHRGLIGPKSPEMEDPGPWPFLPATVPAPALDEFAEQREYRLLDAPFVIRYQTAAIAAAIHPRFVNLASAVPVPHGRTFAISAYGSGFVLTAEGSSTYYRSLAALAYHLHFALMRCAHPGLDAMASLHAALAAYGAGSLALVAASGSGKSTLAAALASEGMRVACDDRLFLDFASGLPAAAPNAIGLKRGSWRALESRYPAILDLPCVHLENEVRYLPSPAPADRLFPPLTHIFFPQHDPAAVTRAYHLSGLEALERLCAPESWISPEPDRLRTFLQLVESAHCFALPFSNLDAAVAQIEGFVRA